MFYTSVGTYPPGRPTPEEQFNFFCGPFSLAVAFGRPRGVTNQVLCMVLTTSSVFTLPRGLLGIPEIRRRALTTKTSAAIAVIVFAPAGTSAAATTVAFADSLAATSSPALTFDVQLPMLGNVPQGAHATLRWANDNQ